MSPNNLTQPEGANTTPTTRDAMLESLEDPGLATESLTFADTTAHTDVFSNDAALPADLEESGLTVVDVGESGLVSTKSDPFAGLMLPTPSVELPANADPLTHYLARLRYIEPLPASEQQSLAIKYKEASDLKAAQLLILTNLRLVVKIAREYQRRWANLLDLIQEGNVGLAEAVKRYDPYRGVKFTSYAQYWIRAMILNYLMNHFQPVKIGSTRAGRKLFYNLKKAREQLRRQGYLATPAAIAEMLDVSEAEVVRVSEYLDAPPISIDATAPGHDRTTYGELLPSTGDSPEQAAASGETSSQLFETIRDFGEELTKERERAIWFERMIAEDPRSLVELGEQFGVSKERIRQVEAQLRKRFKQRLISKHGEDVQFEFIQR